MKFSKINFLVVANVLGIGFPLVVYVWLVIMSLSGQSGGEFIVILLLPFFVAGYLVAIINVFAITHYLRSGRATVRRKVGSIALLLFSIFIVLTPLISWLAASSRQDARFESSVEVSLIQAAELIDACSLKGISFSTWVYEQNLLSADDASTGIVVSEINRFEPHTLFVAERARKDIEPLLQRLGERCPETVVLDRGGAYLDRKGNWKPSTVEIDAVPEVAP